MNHYLHVLLESAWTASIAPFGNEPTLAAMQAFGGFNLPMAAAISVVGATLGMSFNWLVGKSLLLLKARRDYTLSEDFYAKLAKLFNRYGIFLLLISWLPLGKMLPVAAGFLGTRYRIALPLIMLGEAAHYWYVIH